MVSSTLGVLSSMLCATVAAGATVRATDPLVQIVGRKLCHSDGSCTFDSPGVSTRFTVSGATHVTISMAAMHDSRVNETTGETFFTPNFFEVEVNGKRQPYRISTATSQNLTATTYTVAHIWGGSASKTDINIFKSTEAEWNAVHPQPAYVTLLSISIDAGSFVTPPPLSSRKIEFVGDSITAGFCNLCHQTPHDKDVYLESFYDSWASQICRKAGADCHAAAWSGYGVVRNYNPGTVMMPDIYKRTLLTVDGYPWTYSSWVPNAVVVNLGTNDRVVCVNNFCTEFINTYTAMILGAAKSYGHSTTWFLACGPMSTAYCTQVHEIIVNVRKQGVNAFYLDQTPYTGNNTCCGHPSVSGDTQIADGIYDFIAEKLGWQ